MWDMPSYKGSATATRAGANRRGANGAADGWEGVARCAVADGNARAGMARAHDGGMAMGSRDRTRFAEGSLPSSTLEEARVDCCEVLLVVGLTLITRFRIGAVAERKLIMCFCDVNKFTEKIFRHAWRRPGKIPARHRVPRHGAVQRKIMIAKKRGKYASMRNASAREDHHRIRWRLSRRQQKRTRKKFSDALRQSAGNAPPATDCAKLRGFFRRQSPVERRPSHRSKAARRLQERIRAAARRMQSTLDAAIAGNETGRRSGRFGLPRAIGEVQ